jgi:hypothetical protein
MKNTSRLLNTKVKTQNVKANWPNPQRPKVKTRIYKGTGQIPNHTKAQGKNPECLKALGKIPKGQHLFLLQQ